MPLGPLLSFLASIGLFEAGRLGAGFLGRRLFGGAGGAAAGSAEAVGSRLAKYLSGSAAGQTVDRGLARATSALPQAIGKRANVSSIIPTLVGGAAGLGTLGAGFALSGMGEGDEGPGFRGENDLRDIELFAGQPMPNAAHQGQGLNRMFQEAALRDALAGAVGDDVDVDEILAELSRAASRPTVMPTRRIV